MSIRDLFTNYQEAAEFLKENDAQVLTAVKDGAGIDTVYELPDGSIWQEHDKPGDQYKLSLLIGSESSNV